MFALTREELETAWSAAAAIGFPSGRPTLIEAGQGAVAASAWARVRDAKPDRLAGLSTARR